MPSRGFGSFAGTAGEGAEAGGRGAAGGLDDPVGDEVRFLEILELELAHGAGELIAHGAHESVVSGECGKGE